MANRTLGKPGVLSQLGSFDANVSRLPTIFYTKQLLHQLIIKLYFFQTFTDSPIFGQTKNERP